MDFSTPLIVTAEFDPDFNDLDRLAAQAVADRRNEIILDMVSGSASVEDVFECLADTGLDPLEYAAASAAAIDRTIERAAFIDPYSIPGSVNGLD